MRSSINNFRHFLSFNFSNKLERSFSNFIQLVTTTINTHAPLIKVSRKKPKLMNKPWITKGTGVYGLFVWGSTYPTYLNKLKLFQKKRFVLLPLIGQLAPNR